jgi:ABC-type phosphate transport system substrate-binding protein
MEELQARSKTPLHLTYRGIGSSLGLVEFINGFEPTRPIVDFEMSEIPISKEDWSTFRERNTTVLQMPSFFGAVNFFHTVPDMENLNLTSCLLARIFTRDIKDWAHPDIREINPEFSKFFDTREVDSLGASLRIQVAVRELGSSTALAIAKYLHGSCPQHIPETMVSSLPEWPMDVVSCRGTTGMADCIESKTGTIGFLDVGVGQSFGLQEVGKSSCMLCKTVKRVYMASRSKPELTSTLPATCTRFISPQK